MRYIARLITTRELERPIQKLGNVVGPLREWAEQVLKSVADPADVVEISEMVERSVMRIKRDGERTVTEVDRGADREADRGASSK